MEISYYVDADAAEVAAAIQRAQLGAVVAVEAVDEYETVTVAIDVYDPDVSRQRLQRLLPWPLKDQSEAV